MRVSSVCDGFSEVAAQVDGAVARVMKSKAFCLHVDDGDGADVRRSLLAIMVEGDQMAIAKVMKTGLLGVVYYHQLGFRCNDFGSTQSVICKAVLYTWHWYIFVSYRNFMPR